MTQTTNKKATFMLEWLDLQTGYGTTKDLWPESERRFYEKIREYISEYRGTND